jgi:hypothetical protein
MFSKVFENHAYILRLSVKSFTSIPSFSGIGKVMKFLLKLCIKTQHSMHKVRDWE